MSVLNVETIATDADLVSEVGGVEQLELIQPDITMRDAARQKALDLIEEQLLGRSPAVMPSNLQKPQELKSAVVYGALVRMYRDGMTGREHVFAEKKRDMEKLFTGAMSRSFTVAGNLRGPSGGSFRMERR